LSSLSFCGRVETNFDAFVFKGCHKSIDAVGAVVGYLPTEEAGIYDALGDSLLSSEGLLALKAANIGRS
jgi:hypothetical protein